MNEGIDRTNALVHYGIKGMKWGRRRPVGPDGLVVRSGKAIARKARARAAERKKVSQDYADTKALRKKRPQQLSNAELTALNRRLQLERSYNDLTSNASQMSQGQKQAKDALAVVKTMNDVYAVAKSPLGQAVGGAVAGQMKNTRFAREYAVQKQARAASKRPDPWAESARRANEPWPPKRK